VAAHQARYGVPVTVNVTVVFDGPLAVTVIVPAVAAVVSVTEVVRVLNDNNVRVRQLIEHLLPRLTGARTCPCARALEHAIIS